MPIRYIRQISISIMLIISISLSTWGYAAPEPKASDTEASTSAVPMSDAAVRGIGCLALAGPIMTAAYQYGPTEIMMLVTGAVIVPSSSAQLFISLGGILGAAICEVGSSLTPTAIWAAKRLSWSSAENSNTASKVQPNGLMKVGTKESADPLSADTSTDNTKADSTNKLDTAESEPAKSVVLTTDTYSEPPEMTEEVIEGIGCLAGVLGLSAITLASSPIEIVGLSAGGVAVSSNTPILLLAIAGTVVPGGCSLGSAAALPLVELANSISLSAFGRGVASIFGWRQNKTTVPITQPIYRQAKDQAQTPGSLVQSQDNTKQASGT